MNLGELDVHSVQYNRPRLQNSPSRHSLSPTVANGGLGEAHHDEEYESDSGSSTTADTVIRWETAPPSPKQDFAPNTAQMSPTNPNHYHERQPENTHERFHIDDLRIDSQASNDTLVPPAANLSELQLQLAQSARAARVRMEDFEAGPPTPDADDTQYIRFTIEQLTRSEDLRAAQRPLTGDSDESYPVERIVGDQGLGYMQSIKRVRRPSVVHIGNMQAKPQPQPHVQPVPLTEALEKASEYIAATKTHTNGSELFIPIEPELHSPRYPDLTWKPRILRAASMGFLVFLCLLMIAGVIFCAIFSVKHDGLTKYNGMNFGGQYFLFQYLPQILAAVILVYVEGVMTAVARVVPFTMMTSHNSRRRNNALFMGLYPRSLFLPRFEYFSSEPLLGVCSLMLWPIMFTIPLQSCLFSVVYIDGTWKWTTVQGVAWTLAAIYVVALISIIGIFIFFFHRSTGLIWDPRSLADIMALLPRSNSLDEYQNTEVLASKSELKATLGLTSERLGYWRTADVTQDMFYCIGEEGSQTRRYTIQSGKAQEKTPIYDGEHAPELAGHSPKPLLSRGTDSSLLAKVYSPAIRFRYVPWFLNDTFIILWPIAGFFILVTLIVISFLPSTALSNGFKPLVPPAPNSAGFSAANFLYSLVPSLIGLLLYSGMLSMTQTLYRLTPWAALSRPSGAIASQSLLLDYNASSPFFNILAAIHNRHFLLAALSILTPLMLLLPILAGGLFMAFTSIFHNNEIRMLPNLPAFYILIALLILYLAAFIAIAISLIRSSRIHGARKLHHLPHAVTCLGEVLSFLYASGLVHDAAFRAVKGRADLRTRLVGRRERVSVNTTTSGSLARGEEVRYYFGIFRGADKRSHLGVERVGRSDREVALGSGGRGGSMSRFSL